MKLTSEILHRMFLKNGGLMRQDFAQNHDSSLALNTQEMDIYFHALQNLILSGQIDSKWQVW